MKRKEDGVNGREWLAIANRITSSFPCFLGNVDALVLLAWGKLTETASERLQ